MTEIGAAMSLSARGRRPVAFACVVRGALTAHALAPALGLAGIGLLWWLGGLWLASNPRLQAFTGFAPVPAGQLLAAYCFGGRLAVGRTQHRARARRTGGADRRADRAGARVVAAAGSGALGLPFQILRMVSPLSWMPIAVIAFPSWDGAIVFLIAAAAVWPIVFATAAGVRRVDPAWLSVGRTLGGRGLPLLRRVIMPAVAPDLITGIRLALGTAWIVLVPAEFLCTIGWATPSTMLATHSPTSCLAALVLLIGLIGFAFDALLAATLKRVSWTASA